MHEWALAEGVIETALQAADEHGMEAVSSIDVRIGQLQQIETDIFSFAMTSILAESERRVRGASFDLTIEPATLECRKCSTVWKLDDDLEKLSEAEAEAVHFVPELAHVYIRCPACGSPDFHVARGRGVWIAGVEGA